MTRRRGTWITIDGPAGAGKSTAARHLQRRLQSPDHPVLLTQQPSRTEFGRYVRHALNELDGYPLASVITADRYHHVHTEIAPALAAGRTVICDRYVPSAALDILRGVPAAAVWAMHDALPTPDLAVILTATPQVLNERIAARGAHSRWQTRPDNANDELTAYVAARTHLTSRQWPLVSIDTTTITPEAAAQRILAGLRENTGRQGVASRTTSRADLSSRVPL